MSTKLKLLLVFLYITPTAFLGYSLLTILLSYTVGIQEVSTNSIQIATNKPTESPDKEVSIIFTGDVMLGRTVMSKSIENEDWSYPVDKVAGRLSLADVTFVNLENPIVSDCPEHSSGFTFCSPPESVQALSKAGVDLVTLANNHTTNYGIEGLKESVEVLKKEGIKVTGIGDLETVDLNNFKVGFLGIDLVTKEFSQDIILLINKSKEKVDFLIVGVHWGAEYQPEGGALQREWARGFVGAGADLVVGHHPHWVQGAECISKTNLETVSSTNRHLLLTPGLIAESCPEDSIRVYYSLGNFVFDQMWSEETRKGLAVEVTLKSGKIAKEEMLPIYMHNWAQPEWIDNNGN